MTGSVLRLGDAVAVGHQKVAADRIRGTRALGDFYATSGEGVIGEHRELDLVGDFQVVLQTHAVGDLQEHQEIH